MGDQVLRLMTSIGNVDTDSMRDFNKVRNHSAQQHFARQYIPPTFQGKTPTVQSKSGSLNVWTNPLLVKMNLQRMGSDCRNIML